MIAIVDYKAGNLTSVLLAFKALNVEAQITSDPGVVAAADRVVFPGVGAAGDAMQHLHEMKLLQPLRDAVDSGKPFLGICLGTQIILEHSEEDGGVDTAGILPGKVIRFRPSSKWDKIPQMGWNAVHVVRDHPVFDGIEDESEFYFVHSFAVPVYEHTLASCEYGQTFSAAIRHNNFFGVQFHPERSGEAGAQLLTNFVNL